MQIFHHRFGRIALAGAVIALGLGIAGYCSLYRTPRDRLAALDAKAQPYFDAADRNVPEAVAQLTRPGSLCRICYLMLQDNFSQSHRTQKYLTAMLEKPILAPCRQGAKVYGCDLDTASFLNTLAQVNADYATGGVYAVGGLALEAVFLKATAASLRAVMGNVIARLSVAFGGGAACALADGPFPFGDAIGVVLAVGGTIWSCYDLCKIHRQLPAEMTAVLRQTIRDCQQACRLEAIK